MINFTPKRMEPREETLRMIRLIAYSFNPATAREGCDMINFSN